VHCGPRRNRGWTKFRGKAPVKLWKWHTLVFRCPTCSKEADYALQIVEGRHKGTAWDPSYWCEKCSSPVRARDRWIFGAVYGPLMAITATFAIEALPAGLPIGHAGALAFAAACCAIIGWPLSRALSRHLVFWEPLDPGELRLTRVRRIREEDE
jgi:hypothetical protein